jgi:undecaprenyl diphosphate synthase
LRPDHIAIIMDGNGRWAQKRGRERFFGHVRGSKAAKRVIEQCRDLGISYVTLYAFSTENWGRPAQEVQFLMRLLSRHLRKEKANLIKNNIQFKCIGNLSRIPKDLAAEIEDCVRMTADNTGMTLTFALSYGGRQEIAMATQKIAEKVARGEIDPRSITDATVAEHLQTYPLPDPDLVIRTSGESRLSNFLPWQTAYSEIYVTSTLWPDFDEAELQKALDDFAHRRRRFGKLDEEAPQAPLQSPSSTAVL